MMNIIYFSRADVNYSVDCIDKGNTEYVAEFVQEQTGLAFKCSGSTVKNTQKWIYDLCRQQKCGEMVIFMNIQAILVANITGFVLLLILYISRAITRIKSDTEEKAIDALMIKYQLYDGNKLYSARTNVTPDKQTLHSDITGHGLVQVEFDPLRVTIAGKDVAPIYEHKKSDKYSILQHWNSRISK